MSADRLVAAVLLLQTRGRVTAAELAGELEVSLATARRDPGRSRRPASLSTRSPGEGAAGSWWVGLAPTSPD